MKRAVLLGAALVALQLAGCVTIDLSLFTKGPLEQQVVFGEHGPKILLLDIAGPLTTRSARTVLGVEEGLLARVRQQLDLASKDDEIAALLLRIDSPGGTAIASEVLYDEILRFKRERQIPVVAQMMGIAASGGFYVAMAADEVRAYPSTVTGSIGVVLFGVNLSGLMKKLGVADQTLTTGPFKDAGSPLRPMRKEEREQLLSVTRDLFERFLEVVDAGRPKLDRAHIEELADGRVYSARQALEAGLIDGLGDLPGAVEAAKRAAGISGDARVVVYQRPGELRENLFSSTPPPLSQQRGSWAELLREPGFLYLWTAGLPAAP